jgi:Arc/MetJ-type ribon-helix-helix transcriptional regulator
MKRVTITVPEDLEGPIEAYRRDQGVLPSFTAVVQAALREYLATRGYVAPALRFTLTAAERGSGRSHISVEHDRYLAEE